MDQAPVPLGWCRLVPASEPGQVVSVSGAAIYGSRRELLIIMVKIIFPCGRVVIV